MLDPDKSNDIWGRLVVRAQEEKLCEFSSDIKGAGIRVETFRIKNYRDGVGVELKRTYYRFVRNATGSVLYDQLEDVPRGFVRNPDIVMSPNRANTMMAAALEQQVEVDRLIEEAKAAG